MSLLNPEQVDITVKLVLAMVISAMVGFERERTKSAAGLRTHMLVGVGSTLITVVSYYAYPQDPARIAAGIVTGIGFLGAGTIFKSKSHVRGLTTAASIWAIAGVGIALGLAMYYAAMIATIIILITLELNRFEKGKNKY